MKKPMKQIVIVASLLLMFGFSQLNAQTLVLLHADGTTTDVELSTQPKVTFENGKVLINSTILQMEYPKENVLRFTFKGGAAGIQGVKNEAGYTKEDGKLIFRDVKANDIVGVYDVKGIRIPVRLVRKGNSFELPLSALSSGAYILNVNGRTSKFIKR